MRLTLFIVFLILQIVVLQAQSEKKEIRKGNKMYTKEDFSNAEIHYRKALEKDPESIKANYNLANALYKQKQFDPATSKYEALIAKEKDPQKLAKYYYNLGNTYLQSQKLDKGIEAYKQSLRLNPNDADAKHNLFLAEQMKKQQQKQQQDKDKKDQDKDQNKDKNKDQQNQNKDQQNKDQQNKDQQSKDKQDNKDQQQQQGQQQQISKEDAERLLEALEQDEKDVMKKVQEQKAQVRRIPVEKEW